MSGMSGLIKTNGKYTKRGEIMREKGLKIWEPDSSFYEEHVTFTAVDFIKSLLLALAEIKVTYFTFERTYKDGSHIKLTSCGEWLKHYYTKKLYNYSIFEQNPQLFTDGYMFWKWLKREPIYSEAAMFDIGHGITIIQSDVNYCDFYHFGSSCTNYLPEARLLGNLQYLYQFIALFKEKAHKLILEAENERFILPFDFGSNNSDHHDFDVSDGQTNKDSFQNFSVNLFQNIKRLYIGDCGRYLTGKEIRILAHLKRGKKVPDIAQHLAISVRTVETHINNIKDKLNCKTMFELGFTMNNLNIHNILPSNLKGSVVLTEMGIV